MVILIPPCLQHVTLHHRRRRRSVSSPTGEARQDETQRNAALLLLVQDGDDAGSVDADALPGGLRHVEVRPRRVAPAAAVAGLRPVGRAEVGGRDGHRGAAPAPGGRVAVAHHQVALTARRAVVEQHRAQRRRVRPVPGLVQVAIPARATYYYSHINCWLIY